MSYFILNYFSYSQLFTSQFGIITLYFINPKWLTKEEEYHRSAVWIVAEVKNAPPGQDFLHIAALSLTFTTFTGVGLFIVNKLSSFRASPCPTCFSALENITWIIALSQLHSSQYNFFYCVIALFVYIVFKRAYCKLLLVHFRIWVIW